MTNETPDAPPPSPTPSTPPPSTPPPSTPEAARDRPWSPTALPTTLIALGVGLMGAGIAVAAAFGRDEGELDVPVYTVGLVATAVLLVVSAAASAWSARAGKERGPDVRQLAGWSGAVAVLGLAVLLAIGLDDVAALGYLLGAVVTALSVVGYVVSRHGAFVVTTIVGLGLLYVNGFEDAFPDLVRGDHPVAIVALGIGAFVAAVTVVGWLLPTRVLSSQVVGWVGVLGCSALLAGVVVVNLISQFVDDMFGDMFGGMLGEDSPFAPLEGMADEMPGGLDVPGIGADLPDLTTDVWLVLAVAAGLTLLWALAGARTKHAGFTLLAVVMPVVTVPLAAVALTVEYPTAWVAALAVPGALLLGGAALLAVRRR